MVNRAPASVGLIPACAGKTRKTTRVHHVRRAHPRVCGENSCEPVKGGVYGGSSPRVRGKQHGVDAIRGPRGLIPACAGKTDQALAAAAMG